MGLESGRNAPVIDALNGFAIIETIELRPHSPVEHTPGLVAILDGFRPDDPSSFVGRTVRIRTSGGGEFPARIEAVRDHGTTVSFFLPGLTKGDVPSGSRVEVVTSD